MTPTPIYRWTPGAPEIPADLWSAIAKQNQAVVKRLRRERRPFEIIERKPNRYTVIPI